MDTPCEVKGLSMFADLPASRALEVGSIASLRTCASDCAVCNAHACLIRGLPNTFDLPPTRDATRSARRTDVRQLKNRTISRAILATILSVAGALLTSCAPPSAVMSVPTRHAPSAALVLSDHASNESDMMRNDDMLGAHRDALIRVSDDVSVAVTDRQWEYNGRPYTFYRASTVTRERLVR